MYGVKAKYNFYKNLLSKFVIKLSNAPVPDGKTLYNYVKMFPATGTTYHSRFSENKQKASDN